MVSPSKWSFWLSVVLVGLGIGFSIAGLVAVFLPRDGEVALLVFGGLALLLALFRERLESIEFSGFNRRLRAAAAERFQWAEESARQGDGQAAERLRSEARTLMGLTGPLADDYRAVRGPMPSGTERARRLDEVYDRALLMAEGQSFQPEQVRDWLMFGDEGRRVTALAVMQANPGLRDFDAVLAAIRAASSGFEQFRAMQVAAEMMGGLDDERRGRLAEAVRAERGVRFQQGSHRWDVAERILAGAPGTPASGTQLFGTTASGTPAAGSAAGTTAPGAPAPGGPVPDGTVRLPATPDRDEPAAEPAPAEPARTSGDPGDTARLPGDTGRG
ncbi:hypothetical protein [Allonocardiopsis opalescens]|uniref:Uncharacterized protein n=1 Tax=Allonocardiopsis opalescens TaxID=1144618 RepID=A0A2T0Q2Q5_9ACTN|nr:hypothetical protein [Allonocardiopsis opalescens]PRX98074.1 hypothetical protein CLV72_105427 [Allonocardiopsis opalescens]